MSFFTYILQCSDGSLYTGWTNHLEKRLLQHNLCKGAKYTRSRLPVKLLAHWQLSSRQAAMSLEAKIKRLKRRQKEQLIKIGSDLSVAETFLRQIRSQSSAEVEPAQPLSSL